MIERRSRTAAILPSVYTALFRRYGPQGWWPARTPFEVIVGAILTQNTSWSNVEKAILELRRTGMLSYKRMSRCPRRRLARTIRSAGSFNVKAARLQSFMDALRRRHRGSLGRLFSEPTSAVRDELLRIKGVGPETADCILLYAGHRPSFVVDAYTRRILSRIGLLGGDGGGQAGEKSYEAIRSLCMRYLPRSVRIYNEFHALLVRLAKDHCRKTKPRCSGCPLYQHICNGLI